MMKYFDNVLNNNKENKLLLLIVKVATKKSMTSLFFFNLNFNTNFYDVNKMTFLRRSRNRKNQTKYETIICFALKPAVKKSK